MPYTPKIVRKVWASTLKRYHALFHGGYSVGNAYGAKFLFDWSHSLDKKVAVELYELEQVDWLKKYLSTFKPDLFLDIGAHAAMYSLIIKKEFPQVEVHAFEPDKANLCQLYANLYLNRLTADIKVHEYGISDVSGEANFEDSPESSSRATRRISSTGKNQIKVSKLDDVIHQSGSKIAIKIDVEGHEHAALRGAHHTLNNNECLLQIEAGAENLPLLHSILESLGYRHLSTHWDHFFTNSKSRLLGEA